MHKMVITWWCWHICKGEVVGVETDQVGEENEKKRASYGCLGVGSCNLTCSQIATFIEGGTTLSGGLKMGTATLGRCPKTASTPFCSLSITPSFELQF
jgi:hypothetical protein